MLDLVALARAGRIVRIPHTDSTYVDLGLYLVIPTSARFSCLCKTAEAIRRLTPHLSGLDEREANNTEVYNKLVI